MDTGGSSSSQAQRENKKAWLLREAAGPARFFGLREFHKCTLQTDRKDPLDRSVGRLQDGDGPEMNGNLMEIKEKGHATYILRCEKDSVGLLTRNKKARSRARGVGEHRDWINSTEHDVFRARVGMNEAGRL